MSNGGKRDIIRFSANQRVDLPDFKALQDNTRSEGRLAFADLLVNEGVSNWKTKLNSVYSWMDGTNVSLFPFRVSKNGASTQITVTKGTAFGSVNDATNAKEKGSIFGSDGDATQTLSVASLADGDYFLYVKPTFDAGVPSTRVFFDNAAVAETAQSTNTRFVAGWAAGTKLTSAAADGTHLIIATFTVSSGAMTALLEHFFPLFENRHQKNHFTGANVTFKEWWTELADSNAGVYRDIDDYENNMSVSLVDFAGAVRGQLADVIEGDIAKPFWKSAIPVTAQSNGLPAGTKVSLTKVRDHIDDNTDPHGSTLNQATLNVTTTLNATGDVQLGDGNGTVIIRVGSGDFHVDQTSMSRTAGGLRFSDVSYPPIRMASSAQDSTDGFLTERLLHWGSSVLTTGMTTAGTAINGNWVRNDESASGAGSKYTRLVFDLTNTHASAGNVAMGWYLASLIISAESNVDPPVATVTDHPDNYALTAKLYRMDVGTFGYTQLDIGNAASQGVGSPNDAKELGMMASNIGSAGNTEENLVVPVTSMSEADRTTKWTEGLILVVTLYSKTNSTANDSPKLWGVRVGGKEYYLHP